MTFLPPRGERVRVWNLWFAAYCAIKWKSQHDTFFAVFFGFWFGMWVMELVLEDYRRVIREQTALMRYISDYYQHWLVKEKN